MQHVKDRRVGGFSVYRAGYGEGLMMFTYDEDRNMVPVWVSRFVANRIRESVEYAEEHYWDDGFMAWRQFVRMNFS